MTGLALFPTIQGDKSLITFGDERKTARLEELKLQIARGHIVTCISNMVTVLAALREWEGVFAHDELAEQIMVLRPLPKSRGNPNLHRPRPLQEDDLVKVRMWFEQRLKWSKVAKGDVKDAVEVVARETVISPVRHYLENLATTGVEEARAFLSEVLHNHFGLRRFGAHPDAIRFSELAFRKWLISAVARAFDPGCKADHVLILEGSQGAGKSTAIRILCGDEAFGDSIPPLNSKDAMDYVRGKWIIELAELSSMSKAEVEHVKAYITRTEEKFRPAYGHVSVTYQRRCVFVGTTNRTDYLRDETGNRRFWPIKVGEIKHELLREDRDRIWAAAVSLYRNREEWWLTPEEVSLAEVEQSKRTTIDPLYEEVAMWLVRHGKRETCMTEVARRELPDGEMSDAAALNPQMQHRLRGALNAAGYESTGRKFTSGRYKGMTIFAKTPKAPT